MTPALQKIVEAMARERDRQVVDDGVDMADEMDLEKVARAGLEAVDALHLIEDVETPPPIHASAQFFDGDQMVLEVVAQSMGVDGPHDDTLWLFGTVVAGSMGGIRPYCERRVRCSLQRGDEPASTMEGPCEVQFATILENGQAEINAKLLSDARFAVAPVDAILGEKP